MSCQVNFPIDDIVAAVEASIDIKALGGVLASELDQKIQAAVQTKLDDMLQRITDIPVEKYVVAQGLVGTEFQTTLSDGTVIKTDLSSLK